MAYKPDIQYITQFYVPGSEAHVPAVRQPGTFGRPAPKFKKVAQPQTRVIVDPVALISFVVAIALVITLAVSMIQFRTACRELDQARAHVTALESENIRLSQQYHAGYDLERVYEQAIAMGMVPVEEAKTICVTVTIPTPEPEPTVWEDIRWFLEGLFA